MAPRDEHAYPYAQLEGLGCLLEAQTRRDHMIVAVSGPQPHLLQAIEMLIAHLVDPKRQSGTALQQAEIIHNEVLYKTRLAPWADTWRWCIPAPGAGIGVDHDPILAPALDGSAVYEDTWPEFAANHVRLERCSAAVVADSRLVSPDAVDSVLGPRTLPDPLAATLREEPTRIPCHEPTIGPNPLAAGDRSEIVLPVQANDLCGQSAALVAAKLVATAVAMVGNDFPAKVQYGLFDEWFSEQAPTVITVSLSAACDVTELEQQIPALLRTITDPHSLTQAITQLSDEWAARTKSPSTCARSMAWMLLGNRLGAPFAQLDPHLVERNVSAATVLRGL